MIKRITSFILISTLLCMFLPVVSSAQKADDTWLSYASGSAEVKAADGGMLLEVSTQPGESGVARLKKKLNSVGSIIYFSVNFSADANDPNGFFPDRTVYLSTDTDDLAGAKNTSVLACISGGDLLGGMDYTDMQTPVTLGEKHLLIGAINIEDSSVDLWFDGEYVGRTTTNIANGIEGEELCLIFENTYPVNKKKTLSSEFTIYDVCDSASLEPEITAQTEDYIHYYIDLGVIATSAKINVADAGEYTKEFVGGGFNLTFDEPLDSNNTYDVEITDIETLDGTEHTAQIVLNKKVYSVKLPQKENYSHSELSIFKADITGEIEKVSFVVDGKAFDTVYEPFEIDLSGLSFGTHTIVASALTPDGELVYDKCEISVTEKSEETKISYDFENMGYGDVTITSTSRLEGAIDIYSNFAGEGKFIKCDEVGDHSKALVFGCNTTGESSAFTAACLNITKAELRFKSDVYFYDANSNTTLFLRGLNSANETVFVGNVIFASKNGMIDVQAYDGLKISSVATLGINEWHSLTYEFNMKNQKYSLFIDDEAVAVDFGFNAELIALNNMVRFHGNYKANSPSQMAIDNLSLSVLKESLNFEPGKAIQGDETVALAYGGEYEELSYDPKVSINDRNVPVSEWKLTNGKLTLNFETPIMQTGTYNVSLEAGISGEIKTYFTVGSNSADISDISVFASEGICTVEFTLNEIPGGEDLIYIVNRYSDQKLKETYTMQVTDADGKIENISYNPGDTLKAFVLKKASGAVPFSDVTAQTVLSE